MKKLFLAAVIFFVSYSPTLAVSIENPPSGELESQIRAIVFFSCCCLLSIVIGVVITVAIYLQQKQKKVAKA